jgi:hypothetical protein
METTTTTKNTQLLKDRLKVLTEQLITGKLTWARYQRMVKGLFAEVPGQN